MLKYEVITIERASKAVKKKMNKNQTKSFFEKSFSTSLTPSPHTFILVLSFTYNLGSLKTNKNHNLKYLNKHNGSPNCFFQIDFMRTNDLIILRENRLLHTFSILMYK